MEMDDSLGTVKARRSRRGSHGLSLVELAIILPLLLILSSAAIEYGWLFLIQHELTNVSRQAARFASLPDTTSAQVNSQILTLMTQYGIAKTSSDYSAVLTPSDVTTASTGQLVTIHLSMSYKNMALTNLVPVPSALNATVSMQKEGP